MIGSHNQHCADSHSSPLGILCQYRRKPVRFHKSSAQPLDRHTSSICRKICGGGRTRSHQDTESRLSVLWLWTDNEREWNIKSGALR